MYKSDAPQDYFYFQIDLQFGKGEANYFEGSLADSDPVNNVNSIFIVEPAKLMSPS